mgnify:CR=1 FL=1
MSLLFGELFGIAAGGMIVPGYFALNFHRPLDIVLTLTVALASYLGSGDVLDKKKLGAITFGAAIFQIILLDLVFSIDSILTAVGMTEHLPIMVAAVIIAVGVMLVAADPLANFINNNPTVVMLALGFLLMIGAVLIADGFGVHVPKGYIYAAMAFSAGVEVLNMWSRKASTKRESAQQLRAQANEAEARARAAEADADADDVRA